MRKIPFTKQGMQSLKNEETELTKQREVAVKNLQTARDMGDLSENAAYRVARTKLSSIDYNLRRVRRLLFLGYVTNRPFDGTVAIGCWVGLLHDGRKTVFQVVDSFESDLAQGRLSAASPLGRALMGKKINDCVSIKTPTKLTEYQIISIKPELQQ